MAEFLFGEFKLDTQLYQLSRAGESVEIGAKPFDLLHYLIRHAGRIISKRELIREVWKATAISDSSIPTCISAIRHALNDPVTNPKFIETHRARGYRFVGKIIEDHQRLGAARDTITYSCAPTFVGRGLEMDHLLTALSQSMRGRPEIVLLTGDAGIGKSRLLEEFARTAHDLGAQVLFGRCREDDGAPPYWPWIQLLRGQFALNPSTDASRSGTPAAIIYQLLPDLQGHLSDVLQIPHIEPGPARFRLFEAVCRLFQDVAMDAPLALLIDDLHRADPSSLLLLDFFVSDLRNTNLLLVATYRDTEISLRGADADPLFRIVSAPITRSLQLHSLPRSDVAQIVGQPEESQIVSLLYSQSGGNPLFLTHLIHYHAANFSRFGAVRTQTSPPALPVGIFDVISAQLSALPQSTLNVVDAAAVIGRDFDLPLLAHTLSASSSTLLEPLEIAFNARVIEPVSGSSMSFRFSHVLFRDVAYAKIPRLRRAQLHQQVGRALEILYPGGLDDHVDQLAFHFSKAAELGDSTQAVSYSIRAGKCAITRLAHENAPEHFRHALELLNYDDRPDPRLRCEILIQLGSALNRIGERDSARHHILSAASIAREIDEPTLIARAALSLSPGFFSIEVGTYDRELESLLKDAERRVPASEADLHVRINARLAAESVWSNTPAACDTYSTQALRLAVHSMDPATKAHALSARHSALWGAENLQRRRRLIEEIGALCRQTDDIEILLMYRIFKITVLLEIGLVEDADTEIRFYAKIANDFQLPHAQWYVDLFAAMRYAMEGKFAYASAAADRFLALGKRIKDRNAPQSFAVHSIFRHWETNLLDRILPMFDQIESDFPSIIAWQCAKAFCLSELSRPEAQPLLDYLAADNFAKIPNNETREIALTMLAIASVNLKDYNRVDQLYKLLLPGEMNYTVVGYGVLSFGSRARDLGNLAAAIGHFDNADKHLQFAISQNEKIHSPPWIARSRYDYAAMLAMRRDSKHRDSIRFLARGVHQSAKKLGMSRLQLETANLLRGL